jgi:Cu+-exporting ATPase
MLIGSEKVRLLIASPQSAGSSEAPMHREEQPMAVVVDPVCGMQIESGEAAGMAEYEGVVYYFCSEDCRAKFMAKPNNYVKSS